MAFDRKDHVPFQGPARDKDMEGVYQCNTTGHIHVVKNVWLRPMIMGDDKEPFRYYTCSIKSTHPDIGNMKRLTLNNVPWTFLLPL